MKLVRGRIMNLQGYDGKKLVTVMEGIDPIPWLLIVCVKMPLEILRDQRLFLCGRQLLPDAGRLYLLKRLPKKIVVFLSRCSFHSS